MHGTLEHFNPLDFFQEKILQNNKFSDNSLTIKVTNEIRETDPNDYEASKACTGQPATQRKFHGETIILIIFAMPGSRNSGGFIFLPVRDKQLCAGLRAFFWCQQLC